jgi:hypothetical protein
MGLQDIKPLLHIYKEKFGVTQGI